MNCKECEKLREVVRDLTVDRAEVVRLLEHLLAVLKIDPKEIQDD